MPRNNVEIVTVPSGQDFTIKSVPKGHHVVAFVVDLTQNLYDEAPKSKSGKVNIVAGAQVQEMETPFGVASVGFNFMRPKS